MVKGRRHAIALAAQHYSDDHNMKAIGEVPDADARGRMLKSEGPATQLSRHEACDPETVILVRAGSDPPAYPCGSYGWDVHDAGDDVLDRTVVRSVLIQDRVQSRRLKFPRRLNVSATFSRR
jgi:hypothetical protein